MSRATVWSRNRLGVAVAVCAAGILPAQAPDDMDVHATVACHIDSRDRAFRAPFKVYLSSRLPGKPWKVLVQTDDSGRLEVAMPTPLIDSPVKMTVRSVDDSAEHNFSWFAQRDQLARVVVPEPPVTLDLNLELSDSTAPMVSVQLLSSSEAGRVESLRTLSDVPSRSLVELPVPATAFGKPSRRLLVHVFDERATVAVMELGSALDVLGLAARPMTVRAPVTPVSIGPVVEGLANAMEVVIVLEAPAKMLLARSPWSEGRHVAVPNPIVRTDGRIEALLVRDGEEIARTPVVASEPIAFPVMSHQGAHRSELRGRVEVESSSSLPASVYVRPSTCDYYGLDTPLRKAETDERGGFVVEGLTSGSHRVEIRSRDAHLIAKTSGVAVPGGPFAVATRGKGQVVVRFGFEPSLSGIAEIVGPVRALFVNRDTGEQHSFVYRASHVASPFLSFGRYLAIYHAAPHWSCLSEIELRSPLVRDALQLAPMNLVRGRVESGSDDAVPQFFIQPTADSGAGWNWTVSRTDGSFALPIPAWISGDVECHFMAEKTHTVTLSSSSSNTLTLPR